MSKIVEISTPGEDVACTVGETAELSFEITNLESERNELGAQFLTGQPAVEAWLSIKDSKTKRLEPNEKASFDVSISVPENTAPGAYEFKLLVFDTQFPGEKFEESGSVTVIAKAKIIEEIPTPEAPALRRSWVKTISAFIGAMIATLVVGILGDELSDGVPAGFSLGVAYSLILLSGIVISIITRLNWSLVRIAGVSLSFYILMFLVVYFG